MRGALASAAVVLALTGPPPTAGGEPAAFPYKVIVHPDTGLGSVSRAVLRDVYLKKVVAWPDGRRVQPIDLPPALRERFTRQLLQKTPSQLRSYWNQQIFSGKAVPPIVVDSVEAAVHYVLAHRGAVAYVPAETATGGARVLGLH